MTNANQANMQKKLKIGIIGTGVGLRSHYPGFNSTGQVEFTGLVGSSVERANEFAKKYPFKYVFSDYRELISSDEVDLVCITSPNKFHKDAILYAIAHNKHILCEKPLASDLAEINAIIHATNGSSKLHLVD